MLFLQNYYLIKIQISSISQLQLIQWIDYTLLTKAAAQLLTPIPSVGA